MVRIIFNVAALIQAIIIIVLYLIYGLLDEYVLHLTTHVLGEKINIVALQIAAFICVFTDVRGLQGRLFFLPTWLLCIATSLFLANGAYYITPLIRAGLYMSSILIIVYYCYELPAYLKKIWNEKKAARLRLEDSVATHQITDEEFWPLASKMYYRPSFLFIYLYPVWKYIFRNAIDEYEFLDHYRYLINNMPIQNLPQKIYKKWMISIKEAINKAKKMNSYRLSIFDFIRLGNTIHEVNHKINGTSLF